MWEGLFRVGAGGQRTPLSDRLRAKGGPGEVMQAAIDFGRKQGEEALQRRLRELLGL